MSSIQEKLKLKRAPSDIWSIREQLCLASSVLKSGDQNWVSVSRSLRLLIEKDIQRPLDWYSQKSCAQQYAYLLEKADFPKRKKRESGETTSESIVRKLMQERINELNKILAFQRDEYLNMKNEVKLLKTGTISDEKLQKMWLAAQEEELNDCQKINKVQIAMPLESEKQKNESKIQLTSINIDSKNYENCSYGKKEIIESANENEDKFNKGDKSPLLTSLLKSPSPTLHSLSPVPSSSSSGSNIFNSKLKAIPYSASESIIFPSTDTSLSTDQIKHLQNAIATPIPLSVDSTNILKLASVQFENSNYEKTEEILKKSNDLNKKEILINTIAENKKDSPTDKKVMKNEILLKPPINNSVCTKVDAKIEKNVSIDKDEINEIIGDIEEYIKEETKTSPESLEISFKKNSEAYVTNLKTLATTPTECNDSQIADVTVSLSDSPFSEVAIEEIDSSTSNIAKIIGTSIEDDFLSNSDCNKTNLADKSFTNKYTTENEIPALKTCMINRCPRSFCCKNIPDNSNNQPFVEKINSILENQLDAPKSKKIISQDLDNEEKSLDTVKIIHNIDNTTEKQNKKNSTKEDSINISADSIITKEGDAKKYQQLEKEDNVPNTYNSLEEKVQSMPPKDNSYARQNKDLEVDSNNMSDKNSKIYEFLDEKEIAFKSESKIKAISGENADTEIFQNKLASTKSYLINKTVEESADSAVKTVKHESIGDFETPSRLSLVKTAKDVDTSKKADSYDNFFKKETNNTSEARQYFDEMESKYDSQNIKSNAQLNLSKKISSDSGEKNFEVEDDEATVGKIHGGRIMKTYSKKQTTIVDNDTDNENFVETAEYRAWRKAILLIHSRFASHKYASFFFKPITQNQAPGYPNLIFRPMDLQTIKKNIDNGKIKSTVHFQRDVMLMFQNAIMYNKYNTFVHKKTVEMQEECFQQMQVLEQATKEACFRRETRTASSTNLETADNNFKRKWNHLTQVSTDFENTRLKKFKKVENE